MKKTILTAFIALCGLSVVTTQALTIKGMNVTDLGKLPPKAKAAFVDIKQIIERTRETIGTIEKNIKTIKATEAELKSETSLVNRLKKRRELVKPTNEMIAKTLATTKLFISFIDTHLDEIVKIINKESGQKVEDFARRLNNIVQEVDRTLIGVLTALEPEQETINALQLRPAQPNLEGVAQESQELLLEQ